MPVYPGPATTGSKTWTAGEYPTASQFNTHIRDAVGFLQNPPACRVYHTANQSVPDGSLAALAFNSERFDTDGMHDTATLNTRITIQTAGLYVVSASIQWANSTGGPYRQLLLRLNGSTFIAEQLAPPTSTGGFARQTAATLWKFSAGDYVEAIAGQQSGAALNVITVNAQSPEFSAVWVGLG